MGRNDFNIYDPPFTITHEILNLVGEISKKIGEVNRDFITITPTLRRENRIRTITGTLAIEGNTFNEDKVSAVLEGKKVMGSLKEISEVKGAIKAYENLPQFNPYFIEDLLEAHKLMVGEIMRDAGVFRKRGVGIHKGNDLVHLAPQANMVPSLVSNLLRWVESTTYHPLIVSTVFHYEFEFIHPFSDGNGRVGRLWHTLILSRWEPLFETLPLESVINENQQGYYRSLEISDKNGESTDFIEFMLKAIKSVLIDNAPLNVSVNVPLNLKYLNTDEAVFELIRSRGKITRKEMAEILKKDVRTIGRAISKLRNKGRIRRIGSDKTGYWEIV